MKLNIVEENGWAKSITIQKTITRVGSASSNDVCLYSDQVAPLQLQILSSPDLPSSCRVVNLANELTVYHHGAPSVLPTYCTADMRDGDELEIGAYRLIFELPLASSILRTSSSMEASITFPNAVLSMDYPLEGRLTIKNTGSQKNCQFRVTIRGLPADCYQVDPIPLMYPGAQEEVRLRLFHRITHPEAGFRDVMVVINAPASYPGEELVIRQGVYITPVFEQELVILDDLYRPTQPVPEGHNEPEPEPAPVVVALKEQPVQPSGDTEPPAPAIPQSLWTEPVKRVTADPLPIKPTLVEPVFSDEDRWLVEPVSTPALPEIDERPAAIPVFEDVITKDDSKAVGEELPEARFVASPPPALSELASAEVQTHDQSESEPAQFVETQPTKPRPAAPQDLSKLKVVRSQVDDFWDEG